MLAQGPAGSTVHFDVLQKVERHTRKKKSNGGKLLWNIFIVLMQQDVFYI